MHMHQATRVFAAKPSKISKDMGLECQIAQKFERHLNSTLAGTALKSQLEDMYPNQAII